MPSSAVQTCALDRKSTRLNSSHTLISYAVFFLKKKNVEVEDVHMGMRVKGKCVRDRTADDVHMGMRVKANGVDEPKPDHTSIMWFFFFNDTATTEIYTLSLHDALPIYCSATWPALTRRWWEPPRRST